MTTLQLKKLLIHQISEINDEVFIGFIGDFTLDFGPVPATLILIIFTLIVLRKTRIWDGEILFHQLILIHFVMSVCMVGGMKLYPFSDTGGNLQLIFYSKNPVPKNTCNIER
jgi:hypothetical protein